MYNNSQYSMGESPLEKTERDLISQDSVVSKQERGPWQSLGESLCHFNPECASFRAVQTDFFVIFGKRWIDSYVWRLHSLCSHCTILLTAAAPHSYPTLGACGLLRHLHCHPWRMWQPRLPIWRPHRVQRYWWHQGDCEQWKKHPSYP